MISLYVTYTETLFPNKDLMETEIQPILSRGGGGQFPIFERKIAYDLRKFGILINPIE